MHGLTGRRLAGAALILAIAAACTPASDQPSAEQALCDSLAAFGDSVQAIADTDPATDSVEDIQAAATAAQEAWDQVLLDAADVEAADEAAVDSAWTDLAAQIGDFSTDVPIEDAVAEIDAGVDEVQAAYDEMRNGLGCEGAPAAS
jgi:hypothetical protein